VAAPLNAAGEDAEPEPDAEPGPDAVFDGLAGLIGEPVAAGLFDPDPGPEPDPAPAEAADVPVAMGAVPVAKPVEPAMAEELFDLSVGLPDALYVGLARST